LNGNRPTGEKLKVKWYFSEFCLSRWNVCKKTATGHGMNIALAIIHAMSSDLKTQTPENSEKYYFIQPR